MYSVLVSHPRFGSHELRGPSKSAVEAEADQLAAQWNAQYLQMPENRSLGSQFPPMDRGGEFER